MFGRSKYNQEWRTNPYKERGISLLHEPLRRNESAIIEEFARRRGKALRHLIKWLLRALDEGRLSRTVKNATDERPYWKDAEAKIRKDNHDFLVLQCGFHRHGNPDKPHARLIRGIIKRAVEMIESYKKRNKKWPKAPPMPRNWKRSLYFTDGPITHSLKSKRKGKLRYQLHDGLTVEIPYWVPKRVLKGKDGTEIKSLRLLPEKFGGNLVKEDDLWHFAAMVKIYFKWKYEPQGTLAFDLNKTKEFFLVFSGDLLPPIPHTDAMTQCIQKLQELNRRVRSKTIRSKERRAIRKRIDEEHKKLYDLCVPICQTILSCVVANKLLLCIDAVSPGAKTGTFGHEKVIEILTKWCEDNGIPFVKVEAYYTSIVCNKCKNKAERPSQHILECPICGATQVHKNAHKNAAENIGESGLFIWENGMEALREMRKRYREEKSVKQTA